MVKLSLKSVSWSTKIGFVQGHGQSFFRIMTLLCIFLFQKLERCLKSVKKITLLSTTGII